MNLLPLQTLLYTFWHSSVSFWPSGHSSSFGLAPVHLMVRHINPKPPSPAVHDKLRKYVTLQFLDIFSRFSSPAAHWKKNKVTTRGKNPTKTAKVLDIPLHLPDTVNWKREFLADVQSPPKPRHWTAVDLAWRRCKFVIVVVIFEWQPCQIMTPLLSRNLASPTLATQRMSCFRDAGWNAQATQPLEPIRTGLVSGDLCTRNLSKKAYRMR